MKRIVRGFRRFPDWSAHRRTNRVLLLIVMVLSAPAHATDDAGERMVSAQAAPSGYDRLLPLQGGSNFRDMGGYYTASGQLVRRGLLFRSGVMTQLTEADQEYLAGFGVQRVIDLRSEEERALYPNRWAEAQAIPISAVDYSMADMIKGMTDQDGQARSMQSLYRDMPATLQPQLKLFFSEVLADRLPLVVNCSAGQDRTGIASALLLLALGVPRDVVMQDYLLSTRYRRPVIERGDVDLEAAADENLFAKLMLSYSGAEPAAAKPLQTSAGVPYLRFALDQIEQDYGSITAYLEQALKVDAEALAQLRSRLLMSSFEKPLRQASLVTAPAAASGGLP